VDLNQDKTLFALYIGTLLRKSADNQSLTEQEEKDLDDWRRSSLPRQKIFDESKDKIAVANELRRLNARYDSTLALSNIFNALGLDPAITEEGGYRRRRLVRRLSAAAAIAFLITGAWILVDRHGRESKSVVPTSDHAKSDIPPGRNTAILTLANGSRILLDSAKNGQLAQLGGTRIINKNGQVTYHSSGGEATAGENTLTTPRGGQYQLILPDGSRVWLNAASSITYPTAFSGKERAVTITGEAYFEIASNKSRPFRVTTGNLVITDIGTQFNVMAYSDEKSVQATLVEGSIKVSKGQAGIVLAPGQQAVAGNGSHTIKIINEANIDEVIAWKNGSFQFSNMDLRTIMRQLTRWYDVDVVFEGNTPDIRIGGFIHKNVSLSTVMEFLKGNGVRYKLEGKKITILE
jgi:transmembrane sensor